MNHSCILLGSLRLLSRRGLESVVRERTMKGLEGGIGGKKIAREMVIGEVEIPSLRILIEVKLEEAN